MTKVNSVFIWNGTWKEAGIVTTLKTETREKKKGIVSWEKGLGWMSDYFNDVLYDL